MEWIKVDNQDEIPFDKNIIVKDINGWIGQAYYDGEAWSLETFGQTINEIYFDEIVEYLIITD